MLNFIFKKIIKAYQKFISPVLPARCRYYPTCSEYGLQALAWHGTLKGSLLLTKRVCRCHPLGGHGIDFVPLPLYKYKYYFISSNQLANNNYVYKDVNSYVYLLNFYLKQAV